MLTGALDSEDTRVMIEALRQLGIAIEHDPAAATVRVVGCGGRLPVEQADLYVANSGTTVRFLTAMLALGHGTYRLDGTPRMRERPIFDLLDALRQLGGDAISEPDNGCPPVVVRARGLSGGTATVGGNVSSQFLSGLLMAAPYANGDVELVVSGQELVSKPYVDMTIAVMRSFGAQVGTDEPGRLKIAAPQRYRPQRYAIEPDASAASYFFAAAAITGGEVTVEGLSKNSLQGDVHFCDCLERMGCEVRYGENAITVVGHPLRGILLHDNASVDMSNDQRHRSDARRGGAICRWANGDCRCRAYSAQGNQSHSLRSPGVTQARSRGRRAWDGLKITPRALHGAEIDTYDDHRMAMSLALVGLAVPGVVIRNPDCTAKTYPQFFRDLEGLSRL